MRILFVLHQFFPEFHGGTERVALNLAKMAQRAGHYVHILASIVDVAKGVPEIEISKDNGWLEATFDGIPLTLIERSQLPVTADIGFDYVESTAIVLREWMDGLHFDVAHVMHTMRMGAGLRALQLGAIPYVMTLTDFFLPCARINMIDQHGRECDGPQFGMQCAKRCLTPPWTNDSYLNRFEQSMAIVAGALACVAPSGYVAQKCRLAYPGVEILTIPHGVDLSKIATATKVPAISGAAHRDELRLVFVGSIVFQKGLHILLEALKSIPHAPVSLRIVGGFFCDAAYRREIESAVAADYRVKLIGSMDANQVAAVLADADLLCLPSLVPETFSLVFHESAAAGVPSLVSDLGAPASLLQTIECGGVVPANSVDGWAAAIMEVVNSPQLMGGWKKNLFLPLRIEEEAFFYEAIYQRISIQQTT